MKLRFRQNSMRLRLNRREVAQLASGVALHEELRFPGAARFSYVLEPSKNPKPDATYKNSVIRILAPQADLELWAGNDEIGLYFELPAEPAVLKVAIEKDLECLDGPEEDRDPDAFPREETGPC